MVPDTSREQELEDEVELLNQKLKALVGSDKQLGALMALRYGMTHRLAIILSILVKRAPAVVSRSTFHSVMYGERSDGGPEPKIFDVHISRLRKILPRVGCTAKINTVWHAGYRASPELVKWVQALYASEISEGDH